MKTAAIKIDFWPHQEVAYDFALGRSATYLAMAMGTGKSLVAAALMAKQRRTLILCPKSVLGVWRRELDKHLVQPPATLILDKGTTAFKKSLAEKHLLINAHRNLAVVVNYETAWRLPLGDFFLREFKGAFVILDEAHKIKAPGGRASRWAMKLGFQAGNKLCLSGTPMPNSQMDLFGQFRFLVPELFGTSFVRFRAHYAVTHPEYKSKVLYWINQEDLQERFHRYTYQCDSSVLDLTPTIHEDLTFDLPPATRKVYDKLERELVAELQEGVITASNALVKLLRLQQITSGFCVCDDNDGAITSLHDGKIELLEELIDNLPRTEPVVVFCRFRHDLANVRLTAEKLQRRYGEISGSRHDLTPLGEMPLDVDVLGAQIQSGGLGVDLTRSHYCVYYSLGHSLGDYEQSLARLHRPGQRHAVRYYHLMANDTMDATIYKALANKRDVIQAILTRKEEPCLTPF